MYNQKFIRLGLMGLMVLTNGFALAATFNGTIEAVSIDDKTVTVKLIGKKDETKVFTVVSTASILLDGKKSTLQDVNEGQTVVVTANPSNEASKLALKSAKSSTGPKKTPKNGAENRAIAGSWPQFRGPKRDNISKETGLLEMWPAEGPKLLWEQKKLGEGYSTVAIADGKIFTMGNQGNNEVLLALDAATGEQLWTAKTGGSKYTDGGQGNGPRSTPTVDQDRVYALGASGDLICVGIDKGENVWRKNILRDYEGRNITWGISESVLIDGNQLICTPGGATATIVALDKLTGRGIWRFLADGAPKASYASPILVESGGERMIVNYIHTGVVGIRAKNGNPLWGYDASANGTANCSTPLYEDGMVFTASGYGTGCAMFKLGPGGKAAVGYVNKEMKNHHGGMVSLEGYVYGFDEGVLKCLDLRTGETVWKDRSVGKGSLTYADGHLYLRGENGKVALCKATTAAYEESGQFEPRNRSDRPAWSHPVVCGGRLYLHDMSSLAVYDVKK